MSAQFSEAARSRARCKSRATETPSRHLAVVPLECRPLSVCERWRLGFAILVASGFIAVAERLPRRDHF